MIGRNYLPDQNLNGAQLLDVYTGRGSSITNTNQQTIGFKRNNANKLWDCWVFYIIFYIILYLPTRSLYRRSRSLILLAGNKSDWLHLETLSIKLINTISDKGKPWWSPTSKGKGWEALSRLGGFLSISLILLTIEG